MASTARRSAPAHDPDLGEIADGVLATGEVGMKACADLKERMNLAPHLERARGGPDDPGDELQQCALPGAVSADDRDALAPLHLEVDVVKRRIGYGPAAPEQAHHVEKAMVGLPVELVDLRQARATTTVSLIGEKRVAEALKNMAPAAKKTMPTRSVGQGIASCPGAGGPNRHCR